MPRWWYTVITSTLSLHSDVSSECTAKIMTILQNTSIMEEKTDGKETNADFLNESVKTTIRLPTKVEYRGTTVKERLSQVFRKLAGRVILRDGYSLLDIAVAHSQVLNNTLRLTQNRTTGQQEPMTLETAHHMLSEHEETYTMKTYRQKQLQDQLTLHLSWYNGELKILVDAPRGLFLTLSLSENYPYHFYGILCT